MHSFDLDIDILLHLCTICGASGAETSVREWIQERLPADVTQTVDALGNLIVFKKGKKAPKHKIMFAAHMDEVAFIVTDTDEKGFCRFESVGGVNPDVVAGQVMIRPNQNEIGYYEVGVVSTSAPIHKISKAQENAELKFSDLTLDTMWDSQNGNASDRLKQGDLFYFNNGFSLSECGILRTKAIDDRYGCYVLLSMILQEQEYDAWYVFTVQEEIGLRGAITATNFVRPDIAIVMETTTAADYSGISDEKQCCKLGKGAVVSYMDRRTMYDRNLYEKAREIADACSIPAQTKSLIAGGNDAGAIQTAGNGTRVLAISAPARNLHSGAVSVQISDLEACHALAQEILDRVDCL